MSVSWQRGRANARMLCAYAPYIGVSGLRYLFNAIREQGMTSIEEDMNFLEQDGVLQTNGMMTWDERGNPQGPSDQQVIGAEHAANNNFDPNTGNLVTSAAVTMPTTPPEEVGQESGIREFACHPLTKAALMMLAGGVAGPRAADAANKFLNWACNRTGSRDEVVASSQALAAAEPAQSTLGGTLLSMIGYLIGIGPVLSGETVPGETEVERALTPLNVGDVTSHALEEGGDDAVYALPMSSDPRANIAATALLAAVASRDGQNFVDLMGRDVEVLRDMSAEEARAAAAAILR